MVYLNCAVVPRHRNVPGKGNRVSHFVVVTLKDGIVTKAENVWLGKTKGGEFDRQKSETLIDSQSMNGALLRTVFFAFDESHRSFRTPLPHARKPLEEKQEL